MMPNILAGWLSMSQGFVVGAIATAPLRLWGRSPNPDGEDSRRGAEWGERIMGLNFPGDLSGDLSGDLPGFGCLPVSKLRHLDSHPEAISLHRFRIGATVCSAELHHLANAGAEFIRPANLADKPAITGLFGNEVPSSGPILPLDEEVGYPRVRAGGLLRLIEQRVEQTDFFQLHSL